MNHNFYIQLSEFLREHPTLAIATLIDVEGSTPRKAEAKMVIFPDGTSFGTIGGGSMEKKATEDALEAIKTGKSVTKHYNLKAKSKGGIGQICGGNSSVYIEVITSPDTLLVCGGGHIAAAIVPAALNLGLNVIVTDERSEFASKERFPSAVRVLNIHPADSQIRKMVTASTYIIICTHNHVHDKAALANVVSTEAAYIGMMGSAKKVKTVLGELKKEGVPAKNLNRINTPIGLDIGAETPEEIAISILSEVIHIRRKKKASPASMKITPIKKR